MSNPTAKQKEEAGEMFPIQDGPAIPWLMAEIAYTHYVRLYGHGQSLRRLAERGGFGWYEFLHLYFDDARFDQSDEALRERWKTDVLKMQWEAETRAKYDLSSRDREIREVLEGLASLRVYTHGQPERCWCDADDVETPHMPACLAAKGLWERIQPTKENQ